MKKKDKTKKLKEDLMGEYILFGIFSALVIFLLLKLLFGPREPIELDLVFGMNIAIGILVIGFGSYAISKKGIRNALYNLIIEIIDYLQNKGLISLEHKVEVPRDIKSIKNKIFSTLSMLTDKISDSNKKTKELEDTLSRFTDIKTRSVKQISELKGETRDLTVLFTDVRGFTNMCERITSEEIIRFLNIYFRGISRVIHKYNGVVNKFVGDAVMAVFESSSRIEEKTDHAIRAINASFEIHKLFENILQESGIIILQPIQLGLGIGINSGNAVIGTIGSEERMEFTVVGDTVNLASRLSTMAGIGVTLIGASTYERVKDKVEVIESEPVSIKGKTGLHKVYIVRNISIIER